MGKDPAFLFYPGDYLRDTQCLSEQAQVAYDRIMCEHMRNICISKQRLNFFTKRLSDTEKEDLMSVLIDEGGVYHIEWVKLSIEKRKAYSKSRSENRQGKPKKDMKTYVNTCKHMENANANEKETVVKDCKSSVCKDIIDDLNQILVTTYKHTSKKTQSLINARIAEGFTLDDFKLVHRKKALEWHNDEKMVKFLRPETLYSNKFEGYLNQKESQGRNLTDAQKRNVASFHRLKERIKK